MNLSKILNCACAILLMQDFEKPPTLTPATPPFEEPRALLLLALPAACWGLATSASHWGLATRWRWRLRRGLGKGRRRSNGGRHGCGLRLLKEERLQLLQAA